MKKREENKIYPTSFFLPSSSFFSPSLHSAAMPITPSSAGIPPPNLSAAGAGDEEENVQYSLEDFAASYSSETKVKASVCLFLFLFPLPLFPLPRTFPQQAREGAAGENVQYSLEDFAASYIPRLK